MLINPDFTAGRLFTKAEQVFTRWVELTGQTQSWSLFAPNVWTHVPFDAVELRWDAKPPVLLLSDNEPRDIHRYFRVGYFRLRRFESSIDVGLPLDADKQPEEMQDLWRRNIADRVREQAVAMRAYMEWRMKRYMDDHPDLETPEQVILHLRVYRIPPPRTKPWDWSGPEDHVLARWRPSFRYINGAPPVELYDPIAERFDVLP